MNRLISDLLSLSRVEVNERVRPHGKVDIAGLLQRVTKVLLAQASENSSTVKLELQPDLPLVLGDEDELIQVFQNLIENALKYGAAGSDVTVSARALDTAAGIDGPVVSVAVRDCGEGIVAKHIPRPDGAVLPRGYRPIAGRRRYRTWAGHRETHRSSPSRAASTSPARSGRAVRLPCCCRQLTQLKS